MHSPHTPSGVKRSFSPRGRASPRASMALVRRVPILVGLEREQISCFVRSFQSKTFRMGEKLIKEGAVGTTFFIITSGKVRAMCCRNRRYDNLVILM